MIFIILILISKKTTNFLGFIKVTIFKKLRETHRFARGLFCWVGYPTTEIEFERDARIAGKTKYNYKTMINYAIEGLTSFTTAPLRWATYLGIITAIVALCYAIYVLFMVSRIVYLSSESWLDILRKNITLPEN